MLRSLLKSTSGFALIALFGFPAGLLAQECAEKGNQHTRGADVELSYAARDDDPQPKEKRYARALEKLEEAFAGPEPLPRAYLLGGMSYLGLRDYVGADSMLTQLQAMAPECAQLAQELRFNSWVPLYNRGINSLRAGDEDQAVEAFLQANLIYSDSRSLTNTANILQRRGDADQAIDLYRQALEAGGDPDMTRAASINLAELLRQKGLEAEALAIYSDYATANPDDVLGRLNYAIALMDSGDVETAQEMFSGLLGRDDLSFRQWSQVGIGLYRAQSFELAAQAFEKARALNQFNKETLENLANTYYQSENYEELVPLAETLVARYPYESVHYNLLANAYREMDNADAALETLQKRDGLPFEFLRAQIGIVEDNVYSLDGQVMNRSGDAGAEVSVPVELIGEEGQVVSSEVLTVTLPDGGEAEAFQLQVQVEEPVAGFQYGQAGMAGGS